MKSKLFLLFVLTLLLAACGGGRWHTHEAYTRPSQAGGSAAVYFMLHNASDTDDALLGAVTEIAAAVEIHKSGLVSSGEADHEHSEGHGHSEGEEHEHQPMSELEMQDLANVSGMTMQSRVDLAAGHEVEFAPGGYHIMLIGLTRELAAGETFDLTLHFEHAEDLTIQVRVLAP